MSSKKARKPRYTPEFGRDAIDLVEFAGLPATQVAEDLGISAQSLYAWLKSHRAHQDEHGLDSTEKSELARLRKENAILKQEREILKKAAAFFAKEIK